MIKRIRMQSPSSEPAASEPATSSVSSCDIKRTKKLNYFKGRGQKEWAINQKLIVNSIDITTALHNFRAKSIKAANQENCLNSLRVLVTSQSYQDHLWLRSCTASMTSSNISIAESSEATFTGKYLKPVVDEVLIKNKTPQLVEKDLVSPHAVDMGTALNGLSHIVTPDLARGLSPDLVSTLNHSRTYIREKYPETLRLSFARLKEKLESSDPSVVLAAVSVICELTRKNPRNYSHPPI
ncbi:hypothetical protein EDC96DRAFT_566538 [Choanephora cucurbitarum]|nr:hypothetical protein EDC96DRAFT_566538 [Choanephora cucurbitarum]